MTKLAEVSKLAEGLAWGVRGGRLGKGLGNQVDGRGLGKDQKEMNRISLLQSSHRGVKGLE